MRLFKYFINIKAGTRAFVILMTLSINWCTAQSISKHWETSLPSNVQWMEVNDWGILMVFANDALFGIDPATGDQLWAIDVVEKIPQGSCKSIPGTPIVILENRPHLMVVDGLSGKVVFNSQVSGYKKAQFVDVLFEKEAILVEYSTEESGGLGLYNIYQGTEIWAIDGGEIKAKSHKRVPPLINSKSTTIYYAFRNNLMVLNSEDGEIRWTFQASKEIVDLVLSPSESHLIMVDGHATNGFLQDNFTAASLTSGNSGKFTIRGLDTATGSELWLHDYKSKYATILLREDDFMITHMFSINFIQYDDGMRLWEKEPKYVGGNRLEHVIMDDDGLLFATESHSREGVSYIRYLDWEGNQKWKKSPTTANGIYHMEWLENGILYVSPNGSNILDKTSGKEVWNEKKYISSRGRPMLVSYDDFERPMLLNWGSIIRILPEEQDWEIFAEDLDLKAEPPQTFDKVIGGYWITSSQNALMVDDSGRKKFHRYYPAPEESLGKQLLLTTASIYALSVASSSIENAIGSGVTGKLTNDKKLQRSSDAYLGMANIAMDISDDFGDAVNRRYKELINVKDYKLILTEKENIIGLIKVDMNTGEEIGFIPTEDRKPTYVIDTIEDILYFKSQSQVIQAFKL